MSDSAASSTARTAIQQNSAHILQFLQQHPPFSQMEMAHLMVLIDDALLRFYAAGSVIVQPEDGNLSHWYLIRQGLVTRHCANPITARDTEELLLVAGDGFPTAALLNERSTTLTYTATEDTFCIIIDTDTFAKLLRLSGPFRSFALRGISTLFSQLQEEVQTQANLSLGSQYSLNARLESLATRPPVTCTVLTTLIEAVKRMQHHHVGSIVIVDEQRPMGIFTLRDLRRAIADNQGALAEPMASYMTERPLSLPASATAFDAALLMAEHHIGHLCVLKDGQLAGVVSERDLFALQRVDLVHLARALRQADTVETIVSLRKEMHRLVDNMLAHGADALQVTQVVTQLNDHTTSRAIELVLKKEGDPGVEFNWLVFGSQARNEQGLLTDQDNGLLFHAASPADAHTIREKLLPIAQRINEALDRCGLAQCKGNIMAGNPRLCLSYDEWQQRFDEILVTPEPRQILQASIFFDVRVLWGPDLGFGALHDAILDKAAHRVSFQRQLARAALQYPTAPSHLRAWLARAMGTTKAELHIKRHGLAPFVDATRVLALAARVPAAGTQERLELLAKKRLIKPDDATAWADAYRHLQLVRLQLHRRQSNSQQAPGNVLQLNDLNDLNQRMLRESLRQLRYLQALLRFKYRL